MYESSYDSSDLFGSSSVSSAESTVIFGTIVGFILIITLIAYVVNAVLLGMIFKKAGIESWKAWVPIYNSWILLEMGGQPGWWALLAVVPGINLVSAVFVAIAMYHIGLRFGKDAMFILLALFIPIVWLGWLAFDKTAVWKGPALK